MISVVGQQFLLTGLAHDTGGRAADATGPSEIDYENSEAICGILSWPCDRRGAKASLAFLYPNARIPFGLSTTIRFDLPDARKVKLEVYDVQGKPVRTLVDNELPPGRYALRWDGRNGGSRRTGCGVYFCRMEAGRLQEDTETQRVERSRPRSAPRLSACLTDIGLNL